MKRITTIDPAPVRISDVSNLYEGRTIVYRQQVPMPAGQLSMQALSAMNVNAGLDSIEVNAEDGVATIIWTYRTEFDSGGGGGGGGPSTGGQSKEYELTGSVSQEPITSHPKYQKLYDTYAYNEEDGLPLWYENDPIGGSSSGNGFSKGKQDSEISPMYGVKDYLAANAVYKEVEYYKGKSGIPGGLVSQCGKIDTPGSLGANGKPGRWLRCGGTVRQMGDSYQVSTMWMASQSETNLWKPEIYG
jgi:hypothetical protein